MSETKHDLNLRHWNKIKDLTPKESKEYGYAERKGRGLYQCSKCGELKTINNSSFKKALTVCNNRCYGIKRGSSTVIVRGFNDLATTHPHLVKYFVDKEVATEVMSGGGTKVELHCPYCGSTKKSRVQDFVNQGFGCPGCGNGISYAERFVFNFLRVLNFEFVKQYSLDGGKTKYDFYIPSLNMIIETHGVQHYSGDFERFGGKTLEEEQENDYYKHKLAIENGIKHYIVLNCKKSTYEWIENSIASSGLLQILEINSDNINWQQIRLNSERSLVEAVSADYAKSQHGIQEIADRHGLCVATVYNYLIRGDSLGLCNYAPKYKKRRVVAILKDSKTIMEASSVAKMHRILNYSHSSIFYLCNKMGVNGRGKSRFATTKKHGKIGFYYVGSEEWEKDKHLYDSFTKVEEE